MFSYLVKTKKPPGNFLVYKESMLYRGIFPCHYKIAGEDVHKSSNGPHMFMYMETWIWFGQRLKWPWKEEIGLVDTPCTKLNMGKPIWD